MQLNGLVQILYACQYSRDASNLMSNVHVHVLPAIAFHGYFLCAYPRVYPPPNPKLPIGSHLPLPDSYIPATICFPLAYSNRAVDCYMFFDIVIEYLLPRSADFVTQNSCNMGCVGQLNHFYPSSLGTTFQ